MTRQDQKEIHTFQSTIKVTSNFLIFYFIYRIKHLLEMVTLSIKRWENDEVCIAPTVFWKGIFETLCMYRRFCPPDDKRGPQVCYLSSCEPTSMSARKWNQIFFGAFLTADTDLLHFPVLALCSPLNYHLRVFFFSAKLQWNKSKSKNPRKFYNTNPLFRSQTWDFLSLWPFLTCSISLFLKIK